MGGTQSGKRSSQPLLYGDEYDTPTASTLYCCCLGRKIKLPIKYGSDQKQQAYRLQEYPMLIDPVAFRVHSAVADKRFGKAMIRFVERSGHVSLQDTETDDVTAVSPLIVFCLNNSSVDADAGRALSEAREGNDVFLVVIKNVNPSSTYNNTLSLSAKNRRRIGGCGILTYSTDSRKFQETDDNMDMLRRLRHFLLDAVVEID
ncbi:uncharacterized protein [Haliotis cracherodii]|uniref:uncharacterized protein n=1 Tax=Haliotis cracherodii TaxID=6455 RepID=UPI0039E82077